MLSFELQRLLPGHSVHPAVDLEHGTCGVRNGRTNLRGLLRHDPELWKRRLHLSALWPGELFGLLPRQRVRAGHQPFGLRSVGRRVQHLLGRDACVQRGKLRGRHVRLQLLSNWLLQRNELRLRNVLDRVRHLRPGV